MPSNKAMERGVARVTGIKGRRDARSGRGTHAPVPLSRIARLRIPLGAAEATTGWERRIRGDRCRELRDSPAVSMLSHEWVSECCGDLGPTGVRMGARWMP